MSLSFTLKAATGIASAALLIGSYHVLPVVGPGARIAALKEDVAEAQKAESKAKRDAAAWELSFRSSEAARQGDQLAAAAAVTEANRSCDKRLAEARRSTKVIERIVNAPSKSDGSGCPVRSLVDPGELRDALDPPG